MRETFWSALTEDERAALHGAAHPRFFPARARLTVEGLGSEQALLIEHGWAKVCTATPGGREVLLAIRGPGELVSEGAALGGQAEPVTTTAVTATQTLVIPATRFLEFLDAHPHAWRVLARTLAGRVQDAHRHIQAWASAGSERRLALLLLDLARLSARYDPPAQGGGIEIGPPLSQEEVGNWLDISRETVARALRSLRARGLVHTGWRRITVTDLEALRAYADELATGPAG